jgi:hypothetical protein
MSLIPNPVSEMLQPLLRLEQAVAGLVHELAPVGTLPAVKDELVEVNRTLGEVLEELKALRVEMGAEAARA